MRRCVGGVGLNIYLLLLALIAAAVLGNLSGYWLGKSIGQVFFVDYLKWPKQSTLDKTRVFYDKHGQKGFLVMFVFASGSHCSAIFGRDDEYAFCKICAFCFIRCNHLGAGVRAGRLLFWQYSPHQKSFRDGGLIGFGLVIIATMLKALFNKL